jgi:hypothetical protein
VAQEAAEAQSFAAQATRRQMMDGKMKPSPAKREDKKIDD